MLACNRAYVQGTQRRLDVNSILPVTESSVGFLVTIASDSGLRSVARLPAEIWVHWAYSQALLQSWLDANQAAPASRAGVTANNYKARQ